MHYLIFGNRNSRRVKYWRKAVSTSNFQCIGFEQVANRNFPAISTPVTVRITSPGEDFDTFKLLVKLGGFPSADTLEFEKGRILFHRYWYKGWCLVLDRIHEFLIQTPLATVMNDPKLIQLAFHKTRCQELLQKAGIRIPQIYCHELQSFEQLIKLMTSQKLSQVFLKPAHGSSASGVIMFRKAGNKMLLESTIDLVFDGQQIKLFNHKRLQRYHDVKDIRKIVEYMVPNRLHVEQWVRKRRYQSKSTDFRVLVIDKQPIFVQPRHSEHPITNLHLGNEKGCISKLEVEWGTPVIKEIKDMAVTAAKQLDGLFYAGIDIAVDIKNKVYVLEVNAFGDFLKELYVDYKNTYEYECLLWQQKLQIPIKD